MLVVLIDDAGFGNPSTFGGPIETPNYDRMADEGLRYNRFHVTAMCSPTRAALLTGRNHHAVGMGGIPEFSGGFPGYSAMLPKDAAPFPKVLKENGYSTAAIGKWHLTPEGEQGPAGPFDHWPNAWGFDYYWGFLAPEAGQYDTMIAENEKFIGVQEGKDGKPFYFPEAMTDEAIDWLHGVRGHDADKPWMLYYSTGCSHAPHHVSKEWSDKVQGQVRPGLGQAREETFARQKELGVIPADAELTPAARGDAGVGLARREQQAAVRAPDGGLRRLPGERRPPRRPAPGRDRGDGRAREHARRLDLGRQRRQPGGHPHRHVQRGHDGQRPAAHRRGADAAHAEVGRGRGLGHRDDVPALLDRLGLGGEHALPVGQAGRLAPRRHTQPAGRPLAGTHQGRRRAALAVHARHRHRPDDPRHRRDPAADARRRRRAAADDRRRASPTRSTTPNAPERHTQQYFENFGNRAMYKDGWWLAMRMPRVPWRLDPEMLKTFAPGVWEPDEDPVELYYLPDDFSQANDLAASHPEKVAELQELFWEEAEKYHVKPLLAGFAPFFGIVPPLGAQHDHHVLRQRPERRPGMVPRIYNHSYTISADLHIPDGGAEGVIVADASHLGGSRSTSQDGKLKHTYAFLGVFEYRQESDAPCRPGDVNVQLVFAADEAKPATPGDVTLFVNGEKVGERTAGPHGAVRLQRLRRPGRRPGQRPGRRPQLRGQGAVRVHRHGQEGRLRRRPPPGRRRRTCPPRARLAGGHRPRRSPRRKERP